VQGALLITWSGDRVVLVIFVFILILFTGKQLRDRTRQAEA